MPETTRPQTQRRDPVLARLMLGFEGQEVSGQLAEYLERGLGGVALYPRNFRDAHDLRELTAAIHRIAGRPVLIGIDQEGGTRFALREPFTTWPSPQELGSTGDTALVTRVATAMARELRAAGCNLDFAPMLDLHANPDSPVTRDRSFGAEPARVAAMGAAFHRGLRAGGVLSCAKHFPGHGDAAVDPHLDLPVFGGTAGRLESTELVPFAAAVAAGVPLVMTAHILLPQLDPEQPASLSPKILEEILRGRLEFQGVILADDLGMGAIGKRHSPGEAAVLTFCAGSDMAMLCHDWSAVEPAIAAIRSAWQRGRFEPTRWRAALHRIERACGTAASLGPQPPMDVIGCSEHRALAEEARARL